METKAIVVAVDGSDHSAKAVRVAAGLADASGCPLNLLYVHSYAGYTPIVLGTIDTVELEKLEKETANLVFQSTLDALGKRSESPVKIFLTGDPAQEIIEYMEQNPGTHLVMGRRGLSKIQHLLLGSVSDKVVRHAPGVVTVVG